MNYAQDRLDRKSCSNTCSIEDCLQEALGCLRETTRSHYEDRKAVTVATHHTKIGTILRDMGKCREACFHFAYAWIVMEENFTLLETPEAMDTFVGDYAQMTEFAGFPEIGIVSLLLYRIVRTDGKQPKRVRITDSSIGIGGKINCVSHNNNHCGCGIGSCGSSPCFVPFSTSIPVYEQLCRALKHYEDSFVSDNRQVEKYQLDERKIIKEKQLFLCYFWEGGTFDGTDVRPLPLLLQLLLLKLLYTSSSIGGTFLRLACHATTQMQQFTSTLTLVTPEWKNKYKSHWAYYVFIQSLVIGERIKPHRRSNIGPYHIPLWDIVRGIEERQPPMHPHVSSLICKSTSTHWNPPSGDVIRHLSEIIEFCSSSFLSNELNGGKIEASSSLRNDDLKKIHFSPTMISPSKYPPLFVVGDSHVLSLAWQHIFIGLHTRRTAVPVPITGLKAWHCRPSTKFFTYTNLNCVLRYRLPSNTQTILLSAGEIDCREGIGGAQLQGYYSNCDEAVKQTVNEYVQSLHHILNEEEFHPSLRQILLLPVAPHAYRSSKNGKVVGRNKRRERTMLWNTCLESECNKYDNIFFLNYEPLLRSPSSNSSVGFVLNKSYNADYTHLNSAFLPLVERSIAECGCNLHWL